MSDVVELPNVPSDVVPSAVPADIREANTASIASAITGVCGLSGGGKSSLADTAAEYAYEVHGKQTLCYAIDPGGFGTKRVAMIRAGILHAWDPRNHVNYFETMELATLGAWPETIEDPERGYADPNVKLILPRRLVCDMKCPAGHIARRFASEVEMNVICAQGGVPCAVCGVLTNLQNTSGIDRLIVRHRLFREIGLRIYDSITAMNDAGLIIELPTMSAKNLFARGKEGGSALGSADAFRQGTVSYGTGSEAQVGFMQNRTYGWLMNIRQLPDVVVPTICTFGIEESKKDDESGGLQILGPRIAGKARTSAVPGWIGNLVYASHEPEDLPKGTCQSPNMVFRLWLTTHTDPRDSRKMPILAKHRGTPLGIDYLEDPYYASATDRQVHAWEHCSLGVLFRMLDAQVAQAEAALRVKYPHAPGFQAPVAETGDPDEVVGTVGHRQTVVLAQGAVTSGGPATTGPQPVPMPQGLPPVAGMPRVATRSRRGVAPSVAPPVTAVAPLMGPSALGTSGAGTPPAGIPSTVTPVSPSSEAPSIVQHQLEASIAVIEAKKAVVEGATPSPVATAQTTGAGVEVVVPATAATAQPPTGSPTAVPPQAAAPVVAGSSPTPAPPSPPPVTEGPPTGATAPLPLTGAGGGSSAVAAPAPAPAAASAPPSTTPAATPASQPRVIRRPRPPVQ